MLITTGFPQGSILCCFSVVINNKLQNVITWLKLNKLYQIPKKTKSMIFHTSQRNVDSPNLKIDTQPLEYVGIHFDKHLTWNSY